MYDIEIFGRFEEICHDFGRFFASRIHLRIRFMKRIRLADKKLIQTDLNHW